LELATALFLAANAVDFVMNLANPQSAIRNPQSWRFALIRAFLVVAMILSPLVARGEAPPPEAVNVFHCTFGDEWDVDYDAWPDRWFRRTGEKYPHYVNIGIRDDDSAPGKKCLQIHLDGAAAAIASPPIRVMPRFSYEFEAQLRTERIVSSTVTLTLDFCDALGRVLQTSRSPAISDTKGWRTIQIDHIEPSDPAIDRVVLGLEVAHAAKGDLHGRVSLAGVRLARLPRIAVSTNNPSNVYTSPDRVVVRCELSGIPERDPEIRYQLLDAFGNVLQRNDERLDGRLIVESAAHAGDVTDGVQPSPDGYEGTTEWHPNIPDYGYYRVVVQMLSSNSAATRTDAERELSSRTIYLAVVPPLPMPRRGEFGWTLPDGDSPLSFQDLSRLLPQVGINWVKTPVWFGPDDTRRADDVIRFVELLGASNIDVVGIIDQPPQASDLTGQPHRDIAIADLLSADSTSWAAMLEPVMARLSLRVRWWQLGRDGDVSFVGFQNLEKRIEDVRTALFRFGQDVRIGINWDWASLIASRGPVTWEFQQLVSEGSPTEAEFAELLSLPRENKALRWVTIEPPPRRPNAMKSKESGLLQAATLASALGGPVTNVDELLGVAADYAAQLERSNELIRRMVAAKMHGADAIIVSDPFNDQNGLMQGSGMPGELLLPWRTTAAMIGGAEYLGQMRLPSHSQNQIFRRPDGQVVMVVWSQSPAEETLYLGESVEQFDIFGRTTPLASAGNDQTIRVGPTPSFVLGLNEAVTRWRMAVEFERRQVPSVFAKPHPNALRFRNFFPQGVGGSMKIVVLQSRRAEERLVSDKSPIEPSGFMPDRWTIEPPQSAFQLAADAEMKFPFEIELRNALFGKQPVRIDFHVEADRPYEFSAYSELEVGTQDLTLEVTSYLDKEGTLIVEQLMTNSAEQLADFKCFLRARGQRRQRMQVYRLGKELDRKMYRFGNGRELVGKEMLLELEELNGPRELRYRFIAKDTPASPEASKKSQRPLPDESGPAGVEPPPQNVAADNNVKS
jgi:hypothetical protein